MSLDPDDPEGAPLWDLLKRRQTLKLGERHENHSA
jgi:hypothetical protein